MDRFIAYHGNYSIWQLSKTRLFDLAEFVVTENYKHHKKQEIHNESYMDEIFQVYNEELTFFEASKIFVAKDITNVIVGAIRIMKWNKKDELPITRMFGLSNFEQISPEDSGNHIWHIGRFAVSSEIGRSGLMLFKVLMMYALIPICKYDKGIMLAECDSKLFKTVNLLGLKAIALTDGVEYLGSVTIPIYATRKSIIAFINKNIHHRTAFYEQKRA